MDFNESLTKKIDLESNDGLSIYLNLASQQHHNVYKTFHDFLIKVKPKRILEIGTALGGFTQFLKKVSDEYSLDIKILTYDVIEKPWYNELTENGIDVRIENVFLDGYTNVKQEVIDFINQDGITIVLCDGGYKIGEFNLLSDHIKVGDFIMAHDYCKNSEQFNSEIFGKIWNWHEISESDIESKSIENNLIDYDVETFKNVVWSCKTKQ